MGTYLDTIPPGGPINPHTVRRLLESDPRGAHYGALSRSLQAQLIRRACASPPYGIAAVPMERNAPTTLEELLKQSRALDVAGQAAARAEGFSEAPATLIPVWSGASRLTIWSAPAVNWIFRAWHDYHHILLDAPFDVDGERRVARASAKGIEGEAERAILYAEGFGQVLYHAQHGAFPHDQRRFVVDCIRFGVETTIERGVYHRLADEGRTGA